VNSSRPYKQGSHRALDDIRESVSELKFYRERVFLPMPVSAPPAALAPPIQPVS
jgi:oligoribonuclease (3'-5' exoribonuclease)